MATTTEARASIRRAVFFTSVSSILVPAAGVLTAPVLARALGPVGRGEMAAAIAPAALVIPVATIGLPEALTYLTAKHPSATRSALAWSALLSVAAGTVCLLGTLAVLPFLSAGSPQLGRFIELASLFAIPTIVVGVLRGAAMGRQMWSAVAQEGSINAVLRVVLLCSLWLGGGLTVLVAIVVACSTPLVAAVAYWRLLRPAPREEEERPLTSGTLRPLLSYGSRVWLGSVASMLLARSTQILMAPLSSTRDLGFFVVASTIAECPLIVALAVGGALHGVNSKVNDAAKLTATARLSLLVGFLGCGAMAASLPLWIGPLFGEEFRSATVPTVLLLASSVLCIPGVMAGAGLTSWGRPGLRSLGMAGTLVVSVTVFVLTVPSLGVYGACWASLASNVVLSSYLITMASRVLGVPPRDFVVVGSRDLTRARDELTRFALAARRRVGVGS